MITTLLKVPLPGVSYVSTVVSPFLPPQFAVTEHRSLIRPDLTLSYAGHTVKSLAASIPLVKKGVDYLARQLVDPTLSPEYQRLQRQLQEVEEASDAKTAAYESRLADAASKEQARQEEVQQLTQKNAALVEEKQILVEEKQQHQAKAVKAEQEVLALTQERDALRAQLGEEKKARAAERMTAKEEIEAVKKEHQQEMEVVLGKLHAVSNKALNLEDRLENTQGSLAAIEKQHAFVTSENKKWEKKTFELQEKIDFMVEKGIVQAAAKELKAEREKPKNFRMMMAKLQAKAEAKDRHPRAEVVSPLTPPMTPHLGFQDQSILPPTPQSLFVRMFRREKSIVGGRGENEGVRKEDGESRETRDLVADAPWS